MTSARTPDAVPDVHASGEAAHDDPAHDDPAQHRPWCLPGFCETITHACGDTETLHRGAPIAWQMTGDDADVIMRRGQYGAGETFYEVHLDHRAYQGSITLSFSEDDMARLFTGLHELRDCR